MSSNGVPSDVATDLDLWGQLRVVRRCLPLLRGVRRHLAVLLLAMAALALAGFAAFLIYAPALWNGALQGKPISVLAAHGVGLAPELFAGAESLAPELRRTLAERLTWVLAALSISIAAGIMAVSYYGIWILQRVNQALRLQLVDRLQTLSLRFHDRSRVGDAIYRTYQDSAMVTQVVQSYIIVPIAALTQATTLTLALAAFAPRLALALAATWLPLLALGLHFSRRLRARFRVARETNSALTSRIQESLVGVRVIKAYGLERFEQARFEAASQAAFAGARAARGLLATFGVVVFWVIGSAILVATVFAALATRDQAPLWLAQLVSASGASRVESWLVGAGFTVWTLGLYNAWKGVFSSGAGSVVGLFRTWGRAQDIAVGLDRVFELLDVEPEVQDAPDAVALAPLRERISFRDVSFAYRADRPALVGVSFDAPVGAITALVGPTGSGKSTLMALLLRLFDPESGRIEIDGVDLRRLRVADLRRAIAIALQENVLFAASVRENVRYAVADADDAAVRTAARVACADEFITALPQGYDTELGERGAKLSTGQRQRITIARAILKNAPILVLDEPTASLDAETEHRLVRNLAEWGAGRCVFLVTHRLSTIRMADRIVYLDAGKVAESGTHEALMARPGGAYRSLVESERVGAGGGRMSRPVEAAELSSRQTLAIFARALRFMAPLRGRFAVKLGLTALSLLPMLVLPVPVKILIDHVIGDLPIAGRIASYPMLARPFVRLLEHASYGEILFFTIAAQVLLLVAIGQIGADGGERDRTEAWLSSGVDAATATENAANAGFSFAGGLFGLFDFRWTLRLTQDLNHHYRARLFERIQSLPLHLFDDARIGDAVYRLMYDTPSITQTCYRILLVPTLVPFAIAAYAFTIWDSFDQPRLALAALGFAPLAFIATWPFARLLRRQGKRSREAGATTTAALEEGVANILAVQSQGGEARERERFDRDSARSFARHRGVMALAMLAILAAFVPGIALVRWIFLDIVDLVITGAISLGDFSVLFTYFVQIGVFAVMFGSLWFALQTAAPGLERVFYLMDLEPERDPDGARALLRVRESLRFENVEFAWPDGAPALRGLSFEARLGRITALVGPAGAGKTTLVYHVPRFLRPTRGRVLVDGVDVASVTRDSLRDQIAFVFQENALFDGTIEENLRLANPSASELALRRAVEIAGADEFIRRLPDGFATRLGRAGAGLSVGQKQRLAIARALLRDAPILILDEPTSALDPDTERRLVAALRQAARERIVLVVAHRLSTVREADQILFVREGQIVERGTHEELIAIPGGAYRRYAELQSAG